MGASTILMYKSLPLGCIQRPKKFRVADGRGMTGELPDRNGSCSQEMGLASPCTPKAFGLYSNNNNSNDDDDDEDYCNIC